MIEDEEKLLSLLNSIKNPVSLFEDSRTDFSFGIVISCYKLTILRNINPVTI